MRRVPWFPRSRSRSCTIKDAALLTQFFRLNVLYGRAKELDEARARECVQMINRRVGILAKAYYRVGSGNINNAVVE